VSPISADYAGAVSVGYDGSSFSGLSTATYDSFDLDDVGGRVAAGDVNGDGKDDTVMAYQNDDGSFSYKIFADGTIAADDLVHLTPGRRPAPARHLALTRHKL
jgi:hypothetical protein